MNEVKTALPRGLRNNNPGNLRDSGITWVGLNGHDSDGYCTFTDMEHGVRALVIDLRNKWKRGLQSIAAIIEVYSPPSENNTPAYVKFCADRLFVGPSATLHKAEMMNLALAIIHYENGQDLPDAVFYKGCQLAAEPSR